MDLLFKNSNSGDELSAFQENGGYFIIKRSYGNKQRLNEAARLQANYEDKTLNTYSVPIKAIKTTNTFTQIKMPFIDGYSGQNVYTYLSPVLLLNISDRLITSVISKISLISETYSALEIRDLTKHKLNSVKSAVQKNKIVGNVSSLSKKIEEIVLDELEDNRIDLPKGATHGDLTFSNIIYNVQTDRVWLIDFLPVYLHSPLIDLAKLTQEFKYCWSARYLSKAARTSSKIVGRTAMGRLLEQLPPNYGRHLKVLSLMNLYRILPYVKDEVTFRWVVESLSEEFECEY